MQFGLDDDQLELKRTVRAFLERHSAPGIVRHAAEHEDGFAASAWERLVGEMELTSLRIDSEHGGAGASFVEVGIALEELGRTLLPVPFLPTVVAAAAISDSPDDGVSGPLLERIAAGEIATVALSGRPPVATRVGDVITVRGSIDYVPDGERAGVLVLGALLEGEPSMLALELGADGVEVSPVLTLDQTRRQATVRLTDCSAMALSSGPVGRSAYDRARSVLAIAYSVEAVGAAERCLDLTVAYLGERVQFGRPIGSFQALKHRCADLYVSLEAARSAAYYAAWAVDGAPAELPVLGPLAQLVCVDALLRIAAESIQLHGGIGFTWEHQAHLFFKRAKSTELLCGGRRELRRLVGERAGIV